MKVIKRNGEQVDFDLEKISIAIEGAFEELGHNFEDATTLQEIETIIGDKGSKHDYITVEEIQDIVEESLLNNGYVDEARRYIRYRYEHELARNNRRSQVISEKLMATNVENSNANMDEKSFGGRMGTVTSEVLRQYALENCMSKMARENHLNNEIYIHKLNCA